MLSRITCNTVFLFCELLSFWKRFANYEAITCKRTRRRLIGALNCFTVKRIKSVCFNSLMKLWFYAIFSVPYNHVDFLALNMVWAYLFNWDTMFVLSCSHLEGVAYSRCTATSLNQTATSTISSKLRPDRAPIYMISFVKSLPATATSQHWSSFEKFKRNSQTFRFDWIYE